MSDFSKMRVLVADDYFDVRQLVSTALRSKGIDNIVTAANGTQAKNAIYEAHNTATDFHVVFADWDMPQITGIELIRHFREQPQFNHTAFVMLTSMSQQSQVMEAIKAGATAYMIKPVSHAGIAAKMTEIAAWLAKHNEKAH